MTVRVPLTQGKFALIDDEDADRVLSLTWSLHIPGRSRKLYARHAWVQNGKWHSIKMHRFILGLKGPRPLVDHENGDGLDNRRANLRIATSQQNLWNSGPKGGSGYKGVQRNSSGNYFSVIKRADGTVVHLGTYDSAEDAARIYDAAAALERGEFAFTNFSDVDKDAIRCAKAILAGDLSARPRRKGPLQRLTDADVIDIRTRYLDDGVFMRDLAKEYGVCDAAIQHAISGRTFKHIHDPAPITIDLRGIRNRERKLA